MNPFAIARDTLDVLTRHPLNRDHRFAAAVRYLRWQIGSLIAPGQIAIKFVDDTLLLGSFGMTATSCNAFAGLYEFEDMAFLLHLLRADDLMVDVGANVGVYTVLAAGAAKARCISLEPSPETFGQLMRNIRLNGLEGRVEPHQLASGDRDGTVRFTRGLDAMNRVAGQTDSNVDEVPVQRLDAIVAARAVTALKIDVEGFETNVIRGAASVLRQPSLLAVVMEQNGSGVQYGFDEEALHRELVASGFSLCRYDPFRRELSVAADSGSGRWGNSLYVRELEKVRNRLQQAPRYRVNEHVL
jgi:FkbM family methyltransferase